MSVLFIEEERWEIVEFLYNFVVVCFNVFGEDEFLLFRVMLLWIFVCELEGECIYWCL